MRLYWQRYIMKYSIEDQVQLVSYFNQGTRKFTRQLESLPSLTLQKITDRLKQNPVWVVGITSLTLVVFVLIRYWVRGGGGRSKITFAVHIYQSMLSRLEKKGVRKPLASTHTEFLHRLQGLPIEEQRTVIEITRLYEKSRFGNLSYSNTEKQHLRHLIRQL